MIRYITYADMLDIDRKEVDTWGVACVRWKDDRGYTCIAYPTAWTTGHARHHATYGEARQYLIDREHDQYVRYTAQAQEALNRMREAGALPEDEPA